MADRESRDANDPRDQLRAMNKEARAEFEDEETGDTGGREHVEPERAGEAGREGGEVGPSGGAPDDVERQWRGSTPDERTMERLLEDEGSAGNARRS